MVGRKTSTPPLATPQGLKGNRAGTRVALAARILAYALSRPLWLVVGLVLYILWPLTLACAWAANLWRTARDTVLGMLWRSPLFSRFYAENFISTEVRACFCGASAPPARARRPQAAGLQVYVGWHIFL